mmetsp:Transcript_19487/g.18612  ORF Transcript_19487/g.18612 Transcript_19487/m.18612 type:complete len:113 (-) Transcript_19487:604-942(-)
MKKKPAGIKKVQSPKKKKELEDSIINTLLGKKKGEEPVKKKKEAKAAPETSVNEDDQKAGEKSQSSDVFYPQVPFSSNPYMGNPFGSFGNYFPPFHGFNPYSQTHPGLIGVN